MKKHQGKDLQFSFFSPLNICIFSDFTRSLDSFKYFFLPWPGIPGVLFHYNNGRKWGVGRENWERGREEEREENGCVVEGLRKVHPLVLAVVTELVRGVFCFVLSFLTPQVTEEMN